LELGGVALEIGERCVHGRLRTCAHKALDHVAMQKRYAYGALPLARDRFAANSTERALSRYCIPFAELLTAAATRLITCGKSADGRRAVL